MFSLTSSAYSGGTRSRELAADELDAIDADEARELPVRVQDDVAMHQHRFVNAVRQLAEQLRRASAPRRAPVAPDARVSR